MAMQGLIGALAYQSLFCLQHTNSDANDIALAHVKGFVWSSTVASASVGAQLSLVRGQFTSLKETCPRMQKRPKKSKLRKPRMRETKRSEPKIMKRPCNCTTVQ